MPHTSLRVFSCTTRYTREGLLVADKVRLTREEDLQVNLDDVVTINTLAAPLRRVRNYHVLQHELRLLLSYLRGGNRRTLTVRQHDLLSSARHISAFFIESLGLGVLTAAVQAHYAWPGNEDTLEHFDVLPDELTDYYLRKGVRPDLLFRFPQESGNRLAGEARGRSSKRHKKSAPSAEQRRRLNQILGWSQRHDHHPVTMTWTYTGEEEVKADLFEIILPPPVARREPPVRQVFVQEPVDASPILFANLTQGPADRTLFGSVAEDALFESAPIADRRLGGAEVRGDWAAADLFGSADTLFLLGVLPDRPGGRTRDMIRAHRSRARLEFDPLQVAVFGRLLFVTATRVSSPPPWSEVLSRLG
ncbi:hypothetical protein FNH05_18165 [Amycolatopsis rhizosphaerae]|uniref:Uncharacterized protein n=1 Tax=Amycolatopsis rhizosphaerae TaxID=2053003 RepID=A0A558CH83_9PSEU|nr:hypothetical protein [Amycolatopsis rhizosphaerae]TVT48097.1 hypothetical protein FNH05_18165 [Amycolatopsis rhizosphaerae]